MPEADAVKAVGKHNQKFGSSTKNIVCGDVLCSDIKRDGKANQQSRFQVGGVVQQSVNPTFAVDTTISTILTIAYNEIWPVSPGVTITIKSDTLDTHSAGVYNSGTIPNAGTITNYGT